MQEAKEMQKGMEFRREWEYWELAGMWVRGRCHRELGK